MSNPLMVEVHLLSRLLSVQVGQQRSQYLVIGWSPGVKKTVSGVIETCELTLVSGRLHSLTEINDSAVGYYFVCCPVDYPCTR